MYQIINFIAYMLVLSPIFVGHQDYTILLIIGLVLFLTSNYLHYKNWRHDYSTKEMLYSQTALLLIFATLWIPSNSLLFVVTAISALLLILAIRTKYKRVKSWEGVFAWKNSAYIYE